MDTSGPRYNPLKLNLLEVRWIYAVKLKQRWCSVAHLHSVHTCTLAQCTRLSLNCFHPISTTSRSYANGHFRSSIKGNWTFKSSQIPKSKLRLSHFHPFNKKFEGFFLSTSISPPLFLWPWLRHACDPIPVTFRLSYIQLQTLTQWLSCYKYKCLNVEIYRKQEFEVSHRC